MPGPCATTNLSSYYTQPYYPQKRNYNVGKGFGGLRETLQLPRNHGGALELGAIIGLRREQIHDATQEVHAPGTKAHPRNRIAGVDSWAWPYIAAIVKDKLPTAPLFSEAWRDDSNDCRGHTDRQSTA